MRIENLQNENRKYAKSIENFHVLEYVQDASVSPMNAMNEYFMSKMNVRRRQVVIDIDKDHSAVIQAGAMQWMGGNVQATSGVKGIGDFLGKALKGAVTKETAVKPEYVGEGCLVLEPTYKYIILVFLIRNSSVSMAVNALLIFFGYLVLHGLESILGLGYNITIFWAISNINKTRIDMAVQWLPTAIIIFFAYMIIFGGVIGTIFKKRDIT